MSGGTKTDEEMKYLINRISTIKHWPKHFYLYPFDPKNWYYISGPRPLIMGAFTATLCLLNFSMRVVDGGMAARTIRYGVWMRLVGGFSFGFLYGMYQWGDL